MRRIVAVALESILVDVARRKSDAQGPLAVVLEARDDRDETSISGGTRISAVSREALELGIRPAMTVASAKAREAGLRVRMVHASEVKETFSALAEACGAFGATTAVSLEAKWNDEEVVWIDVTGCAHLHGPTRHEGEVALLAKVEALVTSMGHPCRAAVASGPRIAAAVARYAPRKSRPLVIPPHKSKEALGKLPVASLPVSEETAAWLESLGLYKIGHLATLPPRSLGPRLGESRDDVMMLLEGEDRAPLRAYVPEVLPCERLTLEYGIERTEQVVFVVKALCDRIAARLEGRGEGAMELSIELVYDRAFAKDFAPNEKTTKVAVVVPSPLARAADLLSVLRTRIEALGHQALVRAPVVEVSLSVGKLALRARETRHMFVPEAKAERALPRLCAELLAELGEGRVGTLAVGDSWTPRGRTVLVPYSAKRAPLRARMMGSAKEPVRLLEDIERRPVSVASRAELLLRTDYVSWWQREAKKTVEWMTAWVETEQAFAFLRAEDERVTLDGWME